MMMDWLVRTNGDIVPLILRLTLAAVIFPHGAQKTLGWFGGPGLRGTMEYFTKSGFPAALGFLAITAEFLGPSAWPSACSRASSPAEDPVGVHDHLRAGRRLHRPGLPDQQIAHRARPRPKERRLPRRLNWGRVATEGDWKWTKLLT